jgi:hypothetical protein
MAIGCRYFCKKNVVRKTRPVPGGEELLATALRYFREILTAVPAGPGLDL